MNDQSFNPGFRISVTDILILLGGLIGCYFSASISLEISFIIAFVVGHFFLFCNVFRISRRPEIIWALTFVGLTYPTMTYSTPGWPATIVISLSVTITNILLEMRNPFYHGIFWDKINPNLKQFYEGQTPNLSHDA